MKELASRSLIATMERTLQLQEVQTSMSKEGTGSLIARVVKQHNKRVTSRGTRCPREGPDQSIRLAVSKRKTSFLGWQEMKIGCNFGENK